MKITFYLLMIIVVLVIPNKCVKTCKQNVDIDTFKIQDMNNNAILSCFTNTQLKLMLKINNRDSVNYENLAIKINAVLNDTCVLYENYILGNILALNSKYINKEFKDKLCKKAGIVKIYSEIFYDTCSLDKKEVTIQIMADTISDPKPDTLSYIMPNRVIVTNPEFYSYMTNFVELNVPIYLRIRIQPTGTKHENNLTVKYVTSDERYIKILSSTEAKIPAIVPNGPAFVLDNFCFKIAKGFQQANLNIGIRLYRSGEINPIYSEIYSLKIGSIIEKLKSK